MILNNAIIDHIERINKFNYELSRLFATQNGLIEDNPLKSNYINRGLKNEIVNQYERLIDGINELISKLNDLNINMTSDGVRLINLKTAAIKSNSVNGLQGWINNEDNQIKLTLDLIELIFREQGIEEEN